MNEITCRLKFPRDMHNRVFKSSQSEVKLENPWGQSVERFVSQQRNQWLMISFNNNSGSKYITYMPIITARASFSIWA